MLGISGGGTAFESRVDVTRAGESTSVGPDKGESVSNATSVPAGDRMTFATPKASPAISTSRLVLIKWVGTHTEYNRIDVTKIGLPVVEEKLLKRLSQKKT
jgi:hypothetical protein